MNPVLPRLALHALTRDFHPLLLATRRGQVLHVADAGCCHPEHTLTPTGRLRHGRPLCGTRGRAWHYQDQPTRPLCAWCTAIAREHLQARDWRRLDVLDVLRATAMSEDLPAINAARRALIEAGLSGDRSLVHQVAARRHALAPAALSVGDLAWGTALPLDGTEPHPHPPVRHNFAA